MNFFSRWEELGMKGSRVRFLEQSLATLQYEMAYRALELVKREMCAEKGYKRHNGTHYYFHLVDVTQKLINVGVRDENIITAALLHDIVEDVPGYTIQTIADLFNEEVAEMVKLVTKDPNIDYKKNPEELEKYLERIATNCGAALIKSADRLHNFGTLLDATPEKRIRQALETEKYFLPFFKKCRNLYPWYAAFFFDAKTTIEPHLHLIKEYYEEVNKLENELQSLKKEMEQLKKRKG